jgi:hypothetical protein
MATIFQAQFQIEVPDCLNQYAMSCRDQANGHAALWVLDLAWTSQFLYAVIDPTYHTAFRVVRTALPQPEQPDG